MAMTKTKRRKNAPKAAAGMPLVDFLRRRLTQPDHRSDAEFLAEYRGKQVKPETARLLDRLERAVAASRQRTQFPVSSRVRPPAEHRPGASAAAPVAEEPEPSQMLHPVASPEDDRRAVMRHRQALAAWPTSIDMHTEVMTNY